MSVQQFDFLIGSPPYTKLAGEIGHDSDRYNSTGSHGEVHRRRKPTSQPLTNIAGQLGCMRTENVDDVIYPPVCNIRT